MPNVDINGTVVSFPDNLSGNDLNSAVAKAASQMGQSQKPQSLFDKVNNSFPGVRQGLKTGLDVLNSPFELTGEAVRTAVGGLPFALPTAAKDLGINANNNYVTTQQEPMNVFSLPRKAIQGATVGLLNKSPISGIQEFNQTTPRNAAESLTDAGTALGMSLLAPEVANAPLNAAGKVVKPLLRGAKALGGKVFSATTGVGEPAIEAYSKNPEAIKNALPTSDLANQLPDKLNQLSQKIQQAEGQAYNALGTTADASPVPKKTLLDMIDNIKNNYGGSITPEEETAFKSLDKLKSNIDSNYGANISEVQIKDLLKRVGKSVNYTNPDAGATNNVLKSFKGQLNDLLTSQNPVYDQAMEPVRQLTGLHNDLVDQFKLDYQAGKGYLANANGATERALANVNGPYKSIAKDTLNRLSSVIGEDIVGQAQNAKYAKEFRPGMRAQGSRRTLLGGAVGGGIGHFTGSPALGGIAGAGTGFMLDTQGGPIAAKILDAVRQVPGVNPQILEAIRRALPTTSILGNRNRP